MVKKYTPAIAASFVEAGPVPSDAATFTAVNATDITTTTKQLIKAAPGAGKAIYITQAIFNNKTVAEHASLILQDEDDVEIVHVNIPVTVANIVINFRPPVEVAANKEVEGIAVTTLGDSTITINGFVGTASASLTKGTVGED